MLITALEKLKIPSLVQKLWANEILTPNGSAIAGLIKQNLVRQQLTIFLTPNGSAITGLIKQNLVRQQLTIFLTPNGSAIAG